MRVVDRWNRIDKRQRVRYGVMILGILAMVPPTAFLAQLFGGSAFCGPLCARMAIGTGFMAQLARRPYAVALLGLWLGTTLIAGRWFCSHFCPIGGLTEFGSKLWPKKSRIDYCRYIHAPLFRYGFLAAWIALPLLGLGSICCAYCPQSTLPAVVGSVFAADSRAALTMGFRVVTVALFGVVFGVASRDGRGHCHLLCPIGAVDSLMNAIGARLPFARRVRVRAERCSGCGSCAKECAASAISLVDRPEKIAKISYHACNQCRVCEGICPRSAIDYGPKEPAGETERVGQHVEPMV